MKKLFYYILFPSILFSQTTPSVTPRVDGEGSLGTETYRWGEGHFDELYVEAPSLSDDSNRVPTTSWVKDYSVGGDFTALRPKHVYVPITTASTAIDGEKGKTYGINADSCTLTLPAYYTSGYVDGDEICVVLGVSAARELTITSPSYILRGTGLQPLNTPFNVTGLGTFIAFTKCSNVWVMSYPNQTTVIDVSAYGAVGDGVTDDSAALIAAFQSGAPISLGTGKTYRIVSPLIATCPSLNVIGDNCKIVYDGTYAQFAVSLTVAKEKSHRITGLYIDGNNQVNTCLYVTSSSVVTDDTRPSLYLENVSVRNAYRKTTDFQTGDGIFISAPFMNVSLNNIDIREVHSESIAMIPGSQGLTGITIHASPKNVFIKNVFIKNVYCNDPLIQYDQDGIRIFQNVNDESSTCFISDIVIHNTGGRAIKLHSALNSRIDGVHCIRDADLPQRGEAAPPMIDAQQAPQTITNVRFYFDGSWNPRIINNHSSQPESQSSTYGGAVVSNITGKILNASGNNIIIVTTSSFVDAGDEIRQSLTINNISIEGEFLSFFRPRRTDVSNGTCAYAVNNCIGTVTGSAIQLSYLGNNDILTVSNIINKGSSVPLIVRYGSTGTYVSALGIVGFSVDGQPLQLSSYVSTALPTAANFTGCQIWVSDLGVPAYSDGTNWRKYSDGSTI